MAVSVHSCGRFHVLGGIEIAQTLVLMKRRSVEAASRLGLFEVQGYSVAEGGPVSDVVPGLESLGYFSGGGQCWSEAGPRADPRAKDGMGRDAD